MCSLVPVWLLGDVYLHGSVHCFFVIVPFARFWLHHVDLNVYQMFYKRNRRLIWAIEHELTVSAVFSVKLSTESSSPSTCLSAVGFVLARLVNTCLTSCLPVPADEELQGCDMWKGLNQFKSQSKVLDCEAVPCTDVLGERCSVKNEGSLRSVWNRWLPCFCSGCDICKQNKTKTWQADVISNGSFI